MGYFIYIIITIFEIFVFYKLFFFLLKMINIFENNYNQKHNYSNNNIDKEKPLEEPQIPLCFSTLGFTTIPNTEKEIKSRYKQLCKIYHPDMGGTKEEFSRINNAYKEAMLFYKK